MAERAPATVWAYRAFYAAIALLLVVCRLLPLGSVAGGWPGPDLLVGLTFAWVLRRPDYAPVLLVAAVVLLEDLVLMRPPGLWAAIIVLASEFLRHRGALLRRISFLGEWLMVGAVMATAMLGFRVVVMLTMLPQAGLGQAVLHLIASILCYPLVVVVSHLAFGVRKAATGDIDAYGRRQ